MPLVARMTQVRPAAGPGARRTGILGYRIFPAGRWECTIGR